MLKLILTLTLAPAMLTPVSDTFISRGPERNFTEIQNGRDVNCDIPCYNESDGSNDSNKNPEFISKDGFAFYWLKD